MPGQIKKMIESYVQQMSKGNPIITSTVRSKLCMQGVIPNKYDDFSPDDPVIIKKLNDIAKESNIKL